MFPPTSLNQAVYGGGGNRTRDGFPHKPFSGAHYVYFIQSGDDGPIKIGFTSHPELRLARLQVANPETLHLRATIAVRERAVEAAIHRRFAQHRIRGEWFSPHPDLLDLIAEAAPPHFALMLAPVEPEVDPRLAPDDDDFNLEVLEADEGAA